LDGEPKILHSNLCRKLLQHSQDPAPIFFAGNVFAIKPKTLHAKICRNFFRQQEPQSRFKNNLNHKFTKQTIELPDDTPEP
jgi:hypothetical protein